MEFGGKGGKEGESGVNLGFLKGRNKGKMGVKRGEKGEKGIGKKRGKQGNIG